MKLSNHQTEVMIQRVFEIWKQKDIATFKVDEKVASKRAQEAIRQEFEKEKQIEQEAKSMIDQLERQNPGGFEPHKMFLMIKKKLAKDKGLILEERQSHFAHIITDVLYDDDLVDYSDDSIALMSAKDGIQNFTKEFEAIDDLVRQKLFSLKRGVIENSPEWDTLYRKYYEEELKRKNRA